MSKSLPRGHLNAEGIWDAPGFPVDPPDKSAAELIARHVALGDHIKAQSKKFEEFLKPFREEMSGIENQLLEQLNRLNAGKSERASLSTDAGTAYLSTIVTPKVAERDKYVDFILDNWEEIGNEMLQLAAPQKDVVEQYQQSHEGHLPPGVSTSAFTRVNIRRS